MNHSPWSFYQNLVAGDAVPPPQDMREPLNPDLGIADSPRALYTSPEVHRLEMDRLWPRVWQFACREEEIPEPGDIHVYDIGDMSVLVVRGEDGEIRAFHNSCTHRATKLCGGDSHLREIRCPFHGFAWNLDGELAEVPGRWDFPQIKDGSHDLVAVKSDTWGGFVFINFDLRAEPLASYLEVLPEHLGPRRFEDMYIAAKYRKVLPANWKACIEAFIESFHISETHSQTVEFSDDVNTQYDIYGRHVSRFITPIGVASSALREKPDDQRILDKMFEEIVRPQVPAPTLPEGANARAFMLGLMRAQMAEAGQDVNGISDSELLDAIQYSLFPNMVLFRSLGFPVVYRFLPNGNDPDSAMFDMYIMKYVPAGEERPFPPERVDLGDRPFADVAELADWLRLIYDQDVGNLALQQQGFKMHAREGVTLSRYQESRIRHYHKTLNSYLERP